MVQENATLDFKMLSLNARGIRSLEKRQALLIWLQKQKVDIIFLQETYSTKEVENNWKRQWKGPMFFAHDSNHSCGVLVLVRDSIEFEMKSIITDDNGRYILLNAKVQASDYILGNIYAPNKIKEQCNFFVISLARNRNITAKKAIKILGVHFTYDQTLWHKRDLKNSFLIYALIGTIFINCLLMFS